MSIYQFIDSKDIATYLDGIDYAFTMPEAAFLIYRSRHATLEEKRSAWLEVASSMPDCGMARRLNMNPIPSFRDFLHDFCELKEWEVSRFLDANECIYSGDCENGGYGDRLFSSAEDCISYLQSELEEDSEFDTLTITKRALDGPDRVCDGRLYLNHDFRVTDVDIYGEDEPELTLSLQFEGMWFALPTPFKRGDVVRDAVRPDAGPWVLESLCTWSRADYLENGFHNGERAVEMADRLLAIHLRNGDTSDLAWSGYYMDGRELQLGHAGHDYLSIEYATDGLKAQDQWTDVVSAFLKGRLRFDEAHGLLRYLESRNDYRFLYEEYEGTYPADFYPDHPWRTIRQG